MMVLTKACKGEVGSDARSRALWLDFGFLSGGLDGEDESCHEEAFQVVAVLEHDEGVRLQVRHVDRLPCLHHGRVFSAEKRVQLI